MFIQFSRNDFLIHKRNCSCLKEKPSEEPIDNGVVRLVFDYVEESVNKFDRTALEDWRTSVDLLQENAAGITGLLVRSAKGTIIVGADITGFGEAFKQSDEQRVASTVIKSSAILKTCPSQPLPLSTDWLWAVDVRWHSLQTFV